jgi:polyisoprenoid-binding protein YceI
MARRRTRVVVIVVAAAALLMGGAAVAYFFLFGGDEPPPVSLSGGDGGAGGDAAAAPESISGTWVVVDGDGSNGSFVGYRVTETLFGLGRPSEAVGRTRGVEGTVTIDGTTIASADLTADLSSLSSDDGRRDNVLRGRALETSRHPTASFRLTEPIEIDGIPAPGDPRSITASGELTLHGVTQPVEIPLQAALVGGDEPMIEVAGGLEIAMADFGIEPPSIAGVVTVDDRGTFEVHLFLRQP